MSDLRTAAQQALEVMEQSETTVPYESFGMARRVAERKHQAAITALRAALAEPVQEPEPEPVQEPVAWIPIEQIYPQDKAIDILMGDGSILCALLPQFDGDLWWEGSGTGEKFIDPKYANVTHWRIHGEHTAPPQRKPLTEEEIDKIVAAHVRITDQNLSGAIYMAMRDLEAAHGIGEKE